MIVTLQSLGIDSMTVGQRLQLIDAICDSIPDDALTEPVPAWHVELLENRLAALDDGTAKKKPWAEVKANLRRPQ